MHGARSAADGDQRTGRGAEPEGLSNRRWRELHMPLAGFGCGHAGGKAERTHGGRGLWSGRSVVSRRTDATRLSTGASDTGGSATARQVLPIPERALRVGHLEHDGGTALAV